MYLVDYQIHERLSELAFTTDTNDVAFNAETQIQPCSIDLRLSSVFWEPIGRAAIDLRRPPLDSMPRSQWRRREVPTGQHIALKPGQMVFGRVCESFSLPANLAGKIEGRSSFARMGLFVHCSGDFINPGWRGHMPLQLLNMGSRTIYMPPHVPICQLKLIQLPDRPRSTYGDGRLDSKYADDDGGPSYWWRDKRIRALHERLNKANVSLAIQNDILALIGPAGPDTIARLEQFVGDQPVKQLDNAESVVEAFAKKEDSLRRRRRLLKLLMSAPGILAIGLLLEAVFLSNWPGGWRMIALIATSIVGLPLAAYDFFWFQVGEYFGETELAERRKLT